MIKRVAVIVCNNGLGHIKRTLCLLRLIKQRHMLGATHFDIFVDNKKLRYFPGLIEHMDRGARRLRFHHITADGHLYEREFLARYRNFLHGADYVWSDNLAFPLRLRNDTFLVGSFLWSEVISQHSYYKKEGELLAKLRPRMIACKYFAAPSLKSFTRLSYVGLYEYLPVKKPRLLKRAILVSCGGTLQARKALGRSLPQLRKMLRNASGDITIRVEPDYVTKFAMFDNVKKADFSERMYAGISAAVIRPGVGTVCDALSKGARVFAFSGKSNSEMQYNANMLSRLKVGEKSNSVAEALSKAVEYISHPESFGDHLRNWEKIEFGGLRQTVAAIVSFIAQ